MKIESLPGLMVSSDIDSNPESLDLAEVDCLFPSISFVVVEAEEKLQLGLWFLSRLMV